MEVEISKQVVIKCKGSVSESLYQLFPCLKFVSDQPPVSCKFILEYPEKVKLPCLTSTNIEEEFSKCFKTTLSRLQAIIRGENNDGVSTSSTSRTNEENSR